MLDTVAPGDSASVRIQTASQCARCARGQGCGAGIFSQGVAAVHIHCLSEHVVRSGDQVVVEFEEGDSTRWLGLVAGAYGLPTAGLILSTLTAGWALDQWPQLAWLQTDAWQDLCLSMAALAGLAGGVLAWRKLAPVLLRRADAGRCLRSGRIVAIRNESVEYAEPRHSRSH